REWRERWHDRESGASSPVISPPMSANASTVVNGASPPADWARREAAHLARVAPWAEAFVQRRARGEKHPVWDFMFTYYSFSPGKLSTSVPAVGEVGAYSEGERVAYIWPRPKKR